MTSVASLPLLKITKSCLLQKAFGRMSYQPKQTHERRENIADNRQEQKLEQNERQGQSENLTMQAVRGLYAGRVESFSLT